MAELNPTVYDFETFIDEFPLPQVVKVIDGIYGSEDECTLSALQIIHLLSLENSETVKAADEKNREFYLPLNSLAKVRVLPSSLYQEFYVSVKKLADDFPTYVQACNDDPELQIKAGDLLKLKGVKTNSYNKRFLKCKLNCTNKRNQKVFIPFSYQGKFRTLGDFFEHSNLFLKEVVAKTPQFPVRVKFQDDVLKTKRRNINAGCLTGLNQLGTFTLKEEFLMKFVVATSCGARHENKRTLITIPHNLNISVTPVLPEKNRRCTCQTTKIKNFEIHFNETSFRYGCNVIEGHQDDIENPILRVRNRVTPSVTQSSSGISSYKRQTVNTSLGSSSYPYYETQKKMTCSKDMVERKAGEMPSWGKQKDEYVDMSFGKPESSPLHQQRKNLKATADATCTDGSSITASSSATACAAAADDGHHGGGSGGIDVNGGGSGGIDGNGGGSGSGGIDGNGGGSGGIDVNGGGSGGIDGNGGGSGGIDGNGGGSGGIDGNGGGGSRVLGAPAPTSTTVKSPKDHTDEDLFQGRDGHHGLPPPVAARRNRTTRSMSIDAQQYCPMSGQIGGHLTVQHRIKKTRRRMSDVWPFISRESPPVPASNPQTKSKISRKIMWGGTLKRSKSTTVMLPSEDYHYVDSVPEAKVEEKTHIGQLLSRIRKSKKKGNENVSPVDYLSSMTVDEVSEALKRLNLHRYVETFRANTVDGSLFLDLNDKMLDELQVTCKLDRLKMRKLQTDGWKPEYQ